jgi:hypothetical protein
VTFGYKIATMVMLALATLTFAASWYGWGLDDDGAVKAKSVRQGSLRGRHYFGGGPGFGK